MLRKLTTGDNLLGLRAGVRFEEVNEVIIIVGRKVRNENMSFSLVGLEQVFFKYMTLSPFKQKKKPSTSEGLGQVNPD
jgi:hypothetical protein